jgi:hypothetical protein
MVTTAPNRIRKWSPTLLLTGRYPGCLRRFRYMRLREAIKGVERLSTALVDTRSRKERETHKASVISYLQQKSSAPGSGQGYRY